MKKINVPTTSPSSNVCSDGETPSVPIHDGETPSAQAYFPGNKGIYYSDIKTHTGHNQLPHWHLKNCIYHVVFHLADSVPVSQREAWIAERKEIFDRLKQQNRPPTEYEERQLNHLFSQKVEQYLDAGNGSCLFHSMKLTEIVHNSLKCYNQKKYFLYAYCIMPNHVHVLVQMLGDNQLSTVVQGWKSFTAHAINKELHTQGKIWSNDFFNHIIRTELEYFHQKKYILNNPVNACILSENRTFDGNGEDTMGLFDGKTTTGTSSVL